MKKSTVGVLVAVLAVLVIGGLVYSSKKGGTNSYSSPPTSQQTTKPATNNATSQEVKSSEVAMHIQNFDFQTKMLKVKVGTKVTWTNQDSAHHDISPDQDSPDFVGSGKLLAKGETYSYTFQKAGSYSYHCTPHPYMKATVEVVE